MSKNILLFQVIKSVQWPTMNDFVSNLSWYR